MDMPVSEERRDGSKAESPPLLTPLERQALLLGIRDGRSGARPSRNKRRLIGHMWWLFGLKAIPPLADPRLEALRRIAAAIAAGSPSQAEGVGARLPGELVAAATRYVAACLAGTPIGTPALRSCRP